MECQKQPKISRLKPSALTHTHKHIDDREKVHNFHHHQCLSIWFFLDIYSVWWCYMVVVVTAATAAAHSSSAFALLCSLFGSIMLCMLYECCFVLVIFATPSLYQANNNEPICEPVCVRMCVCLCRYFCLCMCICCLGLKLPSLTYHRHLCVHAYCI